MAQLICPRSKLLSWQLKAESLKIRGVTDFFPLLRANQLAIRLRGELGLRTRADLQQQVGASLGPVHLLLLYHSPADKLVYGRLGKSEADPSLGSHEVARTPFRLKLFSLERNVLRPDRLTTASQ